MRIRGDKKCVCGHMAADHTLNVFVNGNEIVDVEKVINNPEFHCGVCLHVRCKQYTLPNLDLVEYLAEKKGLV